MDQEESVQSQAHNNDDNDNNMEAPETLPYVTTSAVLRQLNQNLQELAPPGEEAYCKPRFELQKRLPDGSTIPASQDDLSASDLQNKIAQSAKFVSQLVPSDRKKWAEQQRQSGNSLFQQGQYKAAMDIYLTCLVVKESSSPSRSQPQDAAPDLEFLSQTLLPVLNNLAQCTLQLGMQKKTKEFCGIALEEIGDNASDIDPIALCKIHFKRAKAHRLTGHYSEARQDLNLSLSFVEKKEKALLKEDTTMEEEEEDDDSAASITNPFRQAIQKEFRHLEAAEKEARKNRQRQKKSMQRALTSNKSASSVPSGKKALDDTSSGIPVPQGPRKYSTLRARKKVSPADSTGTENAQEGRMDIRDLSYWQYYWLVVARVAETLLLLIGDEDDDENSVRARQSQVHSRRDDRKTR
ncbi:unnamed protein product [Cylindrotheca closterium]|uniref:Uncharacterized protein n=1 Tax=Cylindrotheca closterium TaxID=2856 RepID=A0AAD2PWL1_9STRA|nr:unnamed protein product [Cylindrotheca closterium]